MSVAEEQAPAPQTASSIAMIRTLGGVAILSGILIVLVYQATLPRITANKRRMVEKAIFQVIPGATQRVTFEVEPDGPVKVEGDAPGDKIYAGFDAEGNFKGVAIEAAGQGYQDVIRALYGYDPDQQVLTGFTVLESKETPGLGDKIGKDPKFLANFDGLQVKINAEGTGLANPIKTVKHGAKENPWEIDGISGATISSTAVGRMLDASAEEMAPYIQKHLDTIKAGLK